MVCRQPHRSAFWGLALADPWFRRIKTLQKVTAVPRAFAVLVLSAACALQDSLRATAQIVGRVAGGQQGQDRDLNNPIGTGDSERTGVQRKAVEPFWFGRASHSQRIGAEISRHIVARSYVLEFGCGNGNVKRIL